MNNKRISRFNRLEENHRRVEEKRSPVRNLDNQYSLEQRKERLEKGLNSAKESEKEIDSLYRPLMKSKINSLRIRGANKKLNRHLHDIETKKNEIKIKVSKVELVLSIRQAKHIEFLDRALQTTEMCERVLKNQWKALKELKKRHDSGKDTTMFERVLNNRYDRLKQELERRSKQFKTELAASLHKREISLNTPETRDMIKEINNLYETTTKLCKAHQTAEERRKDFGKYFNEIAIKAAEQEEKLTSQDRAAFDKEFRSWLALFKNCYIKGQELVSALEAVTHYYDYVKSDDYARSELKASLEEWKTGQGTNTWLF